MQKAATGILTVGLFLLAARTGKATPAEDAGAPTLPACVQVTTESRWVPYGYNHLVTVKNGCSRAAACLVATDVNPVPQSVVVAPQSAAVVTTFQGAAAQTFVARVTCSLKSH